jgi:hypothetical protein
MNKKPGQVTVTVETGYCPFCFRVRNLRHEARQMGTLVRTTVTCESCHRTLSSTMGVADEEPEAPVAAGAAPVEETAVDAMEPGPAAKEATAKPARTKPAAKPAAKPTARAAGSKAQANKSRPQRPK